MKAIIFIAAFCLWGGAHSFPDHGLKDRKQHKTVSNAALQNGVEGYFLENPDNSIQDGYDLSVAKEFESVEMFGGAPLSSNVPFPPDVPSGSSCNWKKVGSLDMTDPTQQCPPSWAKVSTPRGSCSKKTAPLTCDSSVIGTSGASYQTVCGRFRGYQVGTPDAFARCGSPSGAPNTIENPYVDGISITYGPAGKRQHVFTYAAGVRENINPFGCNCPCAGGPAPPSFVSSDHYCESANPTSTDSGVLLYHADPLWDGQQCGPNETSCCNPPNLAWFCKTFPTLITGDLEIRLCTDEALDNENVALEFYELYIK